MIGPSSYISKFLLTLLFLLVIWYVYMDFMLYFRIQDYPIERSYLNTGDDKVPFVEKLATITVISNNVYDDKA